MSKQHFLKSISFIAVFLGALFFSSSAYAQTKLLRFPDISGDRVVFTYGGDLWTAAASGGPAIRLTSHPGIEVFGSFRPMVSGSLSPDSMTATSKSMWSLQWAVSRDN